MLLSIKTSMDECLTLETAAANTLVRENIQLAHGIGSR